MTEKKLTVAVDVDGVINSYTSGFTGASDFPDPPVEGAIEWLEHLSCNRVSVIFHSCRFCELWTTESFFVWLQNHGASQGLVAGCDVWSAPGKPKADVYIDDRGFRFEGKFPSAAELAILREPWYKGEKKPGLPSAIVVDNMFKLLAGTEALREVLDKIDLQLSNTAVVNYLKVSMEVIQDEEPDAARALRNAIDVLEDLFHD